MHTGLVQQNASDPYQQQSNNDDDAELTSRMLVQRVDVSTRTYPSTATTVATVAAIGHVE